MHMFRFLGRIGLVAICAALMGCSGGGLPFVADDGPGVSTAVLNDSVHIAPPHGYCVDPSASKEDETGAFLLFGTCRGILGQGPRTSQRALLTAAVAPGAVTLSDQELGQLADFLQTDAGHRALSRTGDGAQVRVDSIEQAAGILLVHAHEPDANDLSPSYWRGVFVQSGALVTITVSSHRSAPLDDAASKAIAVDFVAATRAANAAPLTVTPTPTPDLTETVSDETTEGGRGLGALLKRLL